MKENTFDDIHNPAPCGATVSVEITNHGTDTISFRVDGGPVRRLDRNNDQHVHESLESAIQGMYARPQNLPQELALLVRLQGVSLEGARLIFNRLVHEGAQGFCNLSLAEPNATARWLESLANASKFVNDSPPDAR